MFQQQLMKEMSDKKKKNKKIKRMENWRRIMAQTNKEIYVDRQRERKKERMTETLK